MLVKLIDHKGKQRYINPIYVRGLTPKGADETEIEISGWTSAVRVRQPMDDVAVTLNAAMPEASAYIAAVGATANEEDDDGHANAVIGLMG